jgi:thermitase
MHSPRLLALVFAAGFLSSPAPAADWDTPRAWVARTAPNGQRYVSDELLVGLTADADRDAVLVALAARGARPIGEFSALRVVRVLLDGGEDAREAVGRIAAIPGVLYAEPNDVGSGGALGGPNDTHFPAQWHLENHGVPGGTVGADIEILPAWDLLAPPAPVVLAILDSGIDFAHPEFQSRVVPGWDYVAEDADATADHPHGIWCAGLAAAATDNAFGVAGVDRTCTIYPIKVLDAFNGGTVANLVQGLQDCAVNQVDVVSMSLINYGHGQTLENALHLARQAGCILVACGGNGGIGDADVSGPGQSDQTISIGWTGWDDARSIFSGTGSKLDFVAPGDGVVTVSTTHNDDWDGFAGCSAATPVAAGIVAMLKGQQPSLTHRDAYRLLKEGAENQVGPASEDTPGRDDYFGWGRLNARRSIASLTPCAPPVPYGVGKTTSIGTHATLAPHGTPRHSFDDFAIDVTDAIPDALVILFHGPSAASQPWFGGTLLVGRPLVRLPPQTLDAFGVARFPIGVPASAVGTHRYYQAWFRDHAHPDGTNVGMTSGLAVEFGP